MSPVRIRETAVAAAEVRRALEVHPHLAPAIHEIASRTGLSDTVVREHLGDAVLEVLDVLGTTYVREMGVAVSRVQRLRETVHGFYERVLNGADPAPDADALRSTLDQLHDAVHELADPETWAKRKAEQGAAQPAGTGPVDIASHPPAATVPAPAAAPEPPRWAQLREVRRIAALRERQSRALRRARGLAPDLVTAALRGDPGAQGALRAGLESRRMPPAEIQAALEGVERVRNPDPSYALGGRASGRPTASRVTRAFEQLPATHREAVRAAAAADPEFVRTMVTAEIVYGEPRGEHTPWRPEEMDRFCGEHDISGPERADLEAALKQLNQEHRGALRDVGEGGTGTKLARQRAQLLDEAAANLGLPPTGTIAAELGGSELLREIAATAPDQLLDLAGDWLLNAEKRRAEGKPVPSLRRYVLGIMRTQVRGLVGELTAVFRMGPDTWVLKAPDLHVTLPGTDFVVVVRRTGEVWFCDNKALSDSGLGRVSSLVENIGQNMADDVAEFGPEIDRARLAVPTTVVDAVANARTASSEISQLLGGLTSEEIKSPDIQTEITRICDRNGVRRVVTNSGGQLSHLSAALSALGIDLANLEQAVPAHPTRPLVGRSTGGTGGPP